MTKCECGKEMLESPGCGFTKILDLRTNKYHQRIRVGDDNDIMVSQYQ